MTERLNIIFEKIPNCEVFADIGCDHGYIAKAMLDSGKANKVIIADISEKCLKKAQELLKLEIENGKAISVVSNGFISIPTCDLALIAGMGGQEICDILLDGKKANKLPKTLVLQPMKNPEKVRLTAIKLGYAFLYDKVFFSGEKYYNLMLLKEGKDNLTEEEILFGRDNLSGDNPDFKKMMKIYHDKFLAVLNDEKLNEDAKTSIRKKLEIIKKYV